MELTKIQSADNAKCLQLWYYMEGRGTGTLNVYQQFSDKDRSLLVTQSGGQGGLWRFAQTPLSPSGSNSRVSPRVSAKPIFSLLQSREQNSFEFSWNQAYGILNNFTHYCTEWHLKLTAHCQNHSYSQAKAVADSHGSTSYMSLPSKLQLAALSLMMWNWPHCHSRSWWRGLQARVKKES